MRPEGSFLQHFKSGNPVRDLFIFFLKNCTRGIEKLTTWYYITGNVIDNFLLQDGKLFDFLKRLHSNFRFFPNDAESGTGYISNYKIKSLFQLRIETTCVGASSFHDFDTEAFSPFRDQGKLFLMNVAGKDITEILHQYRRSKRLSSRCSTNIQNTHSRLWISHFRSAINSSFLFLVIFTKRRRIAAENKKIKK